MPRLILALLLLWSFAMATPASGEEGPLFPFVISYDAPKM